MSQHHQPYTLKTSYKSNLITCVCFVCVFSRTPLGRARAWLRLALMQKRLADYLRLLISRKDLLRYNHLCTHGDTHKVDVYQQVHLTCLEKYTLVYILSIPLGMKMKS